MVEGAAGQMLLSVKNVNGRCNSIACYVCVLSIPMIFECVFRLGMYRDAEKQFKSALKQQEMIDTYLYLAKVYIRLDQPKTAIEVYKQGLEKFPAETYLLLGVARMYEVSIASTLSIKQ